MRIRIHKLPLYNNIRRAIFTADRLRIAPLVCVDFFHLSVKLGASTVERVSEIKFADPKKTE